MTQLYLDLAILYASASASASDLDLASSSAFVSIESLLGGVGGKGIIFLVSIGSWGGVLFSFSILLLDNSLTMKLYSDYLKLSSNNFFRGSLNLVNTDLVIKTISTCFINNVDKYVFKPAKRFKNSAKKFGYDPDDAIIFKIGQVSKLDEILN